MNRTMTIALLCGAALATPALGQDEPRRDRRRLDGGGADQRRGPCCAGQTTDEWRRSSDGSWRRTQRGDPSWQRQGRGQQASRQGRTPLLEVEGRLVALRTFEHEGESHLLAKIVGTDGKPLVLDLGSVDDLRRTGVRLRGNQNLQASGTCDRGATGERLLVVDRFRADGGPIVIVGVPPGALRGDEGLTIGQPDPRRRSGPRGILVQGTVEATRDVDIEGLPDTHRLVKLATPEGRTLVVDLGKADALGDDLTIERGEHLAVIGRLGRVNGRPVLFATHVADVTTIDREHDRPLQGEDVSQQGRGQRSTRQRDARSRTEQRDRLLRRQQQQLEDPEEQDRRECDGDDQPHHH